MRKFFLLILFSTAPLFVYAQSQTDWIWNPEVSYSWKASDRVAYNTKLSVFNNLGELGNRTALSFLEPQFVMSYSVSTRLKLGGGYYYRWSEPLRDGYRYEHRLLQQVGYVSYIGDRRLAHRLRLEQRIRSSSYQNRLRYRLSYDFPLQGERLDPGERYIILKNEIMTAFNAAEADAENRVSVGLGWFINRSYKFELNAQYRTQDIFSGNGITHLFLAGTSFYFNR
ncbi:DUF2490 domain-containing protein [Rhodohalobacter mucosus]|uniref:DUF2490 domain-containing protein n=1 Tax=Rhodohalobacter mucosus TaxID=2079485 RepID=A0A316TTT6_9BACT|nr:DUF2490 domain-containing protein [Rhodohalobacter mucosus]PWN05704.1 hypothetical protein DDZ15_14050 [Rhodohalobacter mucosus]